MKRTTLDDLMTQIMRLMYADTCCRCDLKVVGKNSQCAHYFSRRYNICRWFLDNCLLLCGSCHDLVDRVDAQEKALLWQQMLGPVRWQALRDRFFQATIRYRAADKKAMAAHYRAEIRRLQTLRKQGVTGVLQAASFD